MGTCRASILVERGRGGMVDAAGLGPVERKLVEVRLLSPALIPTGRNGERRSPAPRERPVDRRA